MRKKRVLRWEYIELLVFLCDQITKWLVLYIWPLQNKIAVVPHLNYTLAFNHGAAFGMLSQAGGWQRWFFIVVAVVLWTVGFLWMKRLSDKDTLTGVGLALIMGGAFGNLLDRARLGYVVDFIDFYINSWHWFTFNIADIAICVGAFFVILPQFTKGKTPY